MDLLSATAQKYDVTSFNLAISSYNYLQHLHSLFEFDNVYHVSGMPIKEYLESEDIDENNPR